MSTTEQRHPSVDDGPPRNLIGYGTQPPVVRWPNGARLAVSICLNVEEGSERTHLLGDGTNEPNPEYNKSFPTSVRDLATESLFEYGSRVGVHRLLDLFASEGVPCTAFACAVALGANPEVGGRLVEEGHEICSHGFRWTELWTLTREEERQHIQNAIELFEEVTGVTPTGWYSRYGPSVNTRELLVEAGFEYDSDAYNDDLPYYIDVGAEKHLVVPYSMMYNDGQFGGRVGGPEEFLKYLIRGFEYMWEEGASVPKMMSIGIHPRLMGQASRTSVLRDFIRHAMDVGDVWFARRDQIARVFREQYPPEAV